MSNVVYAFGAYRLDPAKRELENGGEQVALTPQVFDCLTYLVEHRERAVGRDELIAAVWGRTDVTETLLGQTVMHARRALGDSGDAQRVIKTIPRFGYRWVDESTRVEPTMAVADVLTTRQDADRPGIAGAGTHSTRTGFQFGLALAGAAMAIVLLAVLWMVPGGSTGRAVPTPQSAGLEPLLVLPVSTPATPESAWIPLGLMDSIAGRVRDAGWAVVPSATVVALTGRSSDSAMTDRNDLGSVTGAGLVVQPIARRSNEAWTVRLAMSGSDSMPTDIEATAADPLEAAQLASDRLIALLQRKPLPESLVRDPDAALVELVQRVEAEFLGNRLDAADALLASAPVTWRDRPELRFQRAQLLYRSGQLGDAEQAFALLVEDLRDSSQPQLHARALIGLGSIARTRTQFESAAAFYRQAIALLAPLRQPSLSGMAQAYLGASLGSLRRFEEATQALAQARVTLDGTGDAIGVVIVDAGVATLQADRRRLPDAVARLASAIEHFDRLGAQTEAFDKRIALTQMHRELLNNAAALSVSADAWDRVRNDRSQRLFPMAAAMRAMALIDAGRLDDARAVLDVVDGGALPGIDRGFMWRQTRLARAHLHVASADPAAAERVLADVLPVDQPVPDAGDVWLLRSRVLHQLNRDADASALLPSVRVWSNDGSVEQQIQSLLIEAEHEVARGQSERAWPLYEQALAIADEIGVPATIARLVESYGGALIAADRADGAMAVVGRIATWTDRDFGSALLEARLYHALGQAGAWRRALERARTLAGERELPPELLKVPAASSAWQGATSTP